MKTYQKYFLIFGMAMCLISSISFAEAQNDQKDEEKRKAEEQRKAEEKKKLEEKRKEQEQIKNEEKKNQ